MEELQPVVSEESKQEFWKNLSTMLFERQISKLLTENVP